jgi:hypothetical protein
VFTARYGLIPYMKHVTFRLLKVNSGLKGLSASMIAQHTDNGTEGIGRPTVQKQSATVPWSRQSPGLGLKSPQNAEAKYFHCDKKAPYFGLTLLNAELNPICHLLALLGAHHIPHVSRIRVNIVLSLRERIPVGARIFAPAQNGPGAHPASYTIGTGSFPGVKRPTPI